jgi:hypothetical protein
MLEDRAIVGMGPSLIGRGGIASIYAGQAQAAASAAAIDRFVDSGGVSLFGRPTSEMKRAGAGRSKSRSSPTTRRAAKAVGFTETVQRSPGHAPRAHDDLGRAQKNTHLLDHSTLDLRRRDSGSPSLRKSVGTRSFTV